MEELLWISFAKSFSSYETKAFGGSCAFAMSHRDGMFTSTAAVAQESKKANTIPRRDIALVSIRVFAAEQTTTHRDFVG